MRPPWGQSKLLKDQARKVPTFCMLKCSWITLESLSWGQQEEWSGCAPRHRIGLLSSGQLFTVLGYNGGRASGHSGAPFWNTLGAELFLLSDHSPGDPEEKKQLWKGLVNKSYLSHTYQMMGSHIVIPRLGFLSLSQLGPQLTLQERVVLWLLYITSEL